MWHKEQSDACLLMPVELGVMDGRLPRRDVGYKYYLNSQMCLGFLQKIGHANYSEEYREKVRERLRKGEGEHFRNEKGLEEEIKKDK